MENKDGMKVGGLMLCAASVLVWGRATEGEGVLAAQQALHVLPSICPLLSRR